MGIFSDLKPRNKANRNGFDLSRRTVFSNKPGVIRPCLALPTLPSSEYEIDMAQLMRTQPLQTAAFTGASINYDFIFVPYNHLYSSFNQFIAQREDAEHVNQPDYMSLPSFLLSDYLRFLLPFAAMDYILSGVTDEQWQSSKYNGALADFYIDNMPRYFFLAGNNQSYSLALSSISMLDMLGYGNFLPVVKLIATAFIGTFDAKVAEGTWEPAPFGVDKRIWYICTGLANEDVYDLPPIIMNNIVLYLRHTFGFRWDDYINSFNQELSLWPALAYNKCFYNYYRNTYYDERFVVNYISSIDTSESESIVSEIAYIDYVMLFNCDDSPAFHDFTNDFDERFLRLLSIMSERLHLYKRDMFTGVLPSTQFGSVSSMATDSDVLRIHNLYFNALQDSDKKQVGIKANANTVATISGNASTALNHVTIEPALAISVLEARKADAMQRFKERMLRAGNKTKDIFESHGWDRPKSQSAFEPVFLGSYDGSIDINVVASTTETDNLELGQLAGNGVCVVRGNKIHVKTSDFGVILCLQYIVKSSEYDAYGVEKQHTLLEPFDFPYPELQNISLVPITQNILNHVSPVPYVYGNDYTAAQKVLGYLPRSFEFKTAVDKVHGEFYGTTFMSYSNDEYGGNADIAPLGVFADWVTTRKETFMPVSSYLSFHYIQIDCFDNIFKQRCTSDPATDPFLFNVQFDIKAVEPLSVIGLPI